MSAAGVCVMSAVLAHDERDDELRRLIEHSRLQDALIRMLSDRISKLEGVEPEPDYSGWDTIKEAAHETGYSQSGIRKRIASGKIAVTPLGRCWIIDRASLSSKVR
jgi:hypothetical protein